MTAALQQEQQWLNQLVGAWRYESEATTEPGQPPAKDSGTERVRVLGGGWIVGEGRPDLPNGGLGTTLMTLGYDPAKQRVVGSFVSSSIPSLWIYEGALDPTAAMLTLETEGPSLTDDRETGRYRDTITFRDDDHRVHTSHFLRADGQWHAFLTTEYRRIP